MKILLSICVLNDLFNSIESFILMLVVLNLSGTRGIICNNSYLVLILDSFWLETNDVNIEFYTDFCFSLVGSLSSISS